MRHPIAVAVTAAVVIGAGAHGALGTETGDPQSVRESVDVTLVEVPVRVIDRSGEPVRGLTAADFTLLDQGHTQTLTAFDAIDLGNPAVPGEPRAVPPSARRRYLLLFDFAFARPKAVIAARRAARDFVLTGLRDDDLAAVGTYSLESGVRIVVTFSSDRGALAQAIETLGLEAAERTDPLQISYRSGRPPFVVSAESDDQRRADVRQRQDDLAQIIRTMASLDRARSDDYERGRVRAFFQSLRDLGRVLDVVEGRKDIVLLSEGFPSRLLTGTPQTGEEQQWMVTGDIWKIDSDRRFGNSALRSNLSDMGEFLKRTHCVIHTVDIADFATETGDAPGEAGVLVPRGTQNALFDLSSETGGETFHTTHDVGGELRRLARGTSLVYVLAYRPDRLEGEGKYHTLKVKVGRSGVKVVARPGYFERREFRQRTPFERSLSAADVIANEIPVADIHARVLAAPFAGSSLEAEARVSVVIEIPGGEFLAGETGDRTTLEIYTYAFDGQRHVGDFFAEPLGLDVAKANARLSRGGLRYFGELRLPPGDYRLRTLIRNANTGRAGLAVTPIRVPSFAAGEPYLLDPVFLEAGSENWFAVRGAARSEGRGTPAPSPFAALAGLGGENVVPAAAPHLAPGATARLCVVSYHFGTPGGPETIRIGSQLLDSEGRPIPPPGTLALLGKSAPDPDGRRLFLLAFTAPPDIAPGRYGLRILLEDAATSRRGQATAAFLVSPP